MLDVESDWIQFPDFTLRISKFILKESDYRIDWIYARPAKISPAWNAAS